MALARLLQEQENAFMMLHGDAGGSRLVPQRGIRWHATNACAAIQLKRPPRPARATPLPVPPSFSGRYSEAAYSDEEVEEEQDDDAALARRLQAEEQAELHQRMLAMAGVSAGEDSRSACRPRRERAAS